jgi:hypothetical protein
MPASVPAIKLSICRSTRLNKLVAQKVYTEVISDVRTNRPVLDELLKKISDRAMSWSSGSSIA